MHKKLLSIALGAMLTLSTIAPTFALPDYVNDGINAKYVNIGPYDSYDNFEKFLKNDADATVLVSQRNMADGLSASGLVGAANANLVPVYTSHGSSGVVKDYIFTKDVYIIGGEQVITKELENKLKKSGHNVTRLAGKNRYETSYRVAEEVSRLTKVDDVAIVNGKNREADAVSIASAAIKNKMPIIVTDGKKLNSNLSSVKTYAIGGNSVISESLVKKTKAIRLGGKNRFETNKKIIQKFYPGCKKFMILESNGIHRSFALQAITANQPIVLADVKSDKSVLSGAKELLFVYFETLHPNIESSCLAGAAGKGVYKAYETLYKKLGNKRNSMCYTYNPRENYVNKASLRKDYYIFSIDDFYMEYGDYELSSWDFNYLVNKKTMKIYSYGPDHKLRFVK